MQVKEKVIILKTTRYGDTDLIVNCLTSTGSRLSLFARSALKSKKRFGGGVLEPTHYVHVLYEDKGSSAKAEHPLFTLKEASLIEGFEGLRTDYTRLEAALHVVQMVSDIVKEGDLDSAEIFNLLGNTLRAAEKSQHLSHLRTHFEVKLLANQGILPHEPEEEILMKMPIAEHDRAPLSEIQWGRVQGRTKRVAAEYIGHPTL